MRFPESEPLRVVQLMSKNPYTGPYPPELREHGGQSWSNSRYTDNSD